MKKSPVKGIDARMLRRYLDTRKVIGKKADRIVAVTHLLGLLKHCGDDTVPVSPTALANCADLIDGEGNLTNIEFYKVSAFCAVGKIASNDVTVEECDCTVV